MTAKYTVLGPLMGGKGSSAFLGCTQDDSGGQVRPVVMVFLPPGVSDDEELVSHIRGETEIASNIDHVNVIGVFGLADLDEGLARVVEFADAESLATVYERLKELGRWIPPHVASAVIANAAMGVHYAHELGRLESGAPLLHGGVRPATLMLSFQGMAKVTGYGAGTLAEWLRKERGEEAFIRDPYTSPEQIFGGRSAASEHTDIYALGAVLFEALTGMAPFSGDDALADALIRDDVTVEQLPGVHPGLAEIVVKAMKRRAQDRFDSALDMRQALLDTSVPANEGEVRAFMEDVFPVDFPTRVARMNLLASARKRREHSRPLIPAPPKPVSTTGPEVSTTESPSSAASVPPATSGAIAPSIATTSTTPMSPVPLSPSPPLSTTPAGPSTPAAVATSMAASPVSTPPMYIPPPAPTRVEVRTPIGLIVALSVVTGIAVALILVMVLKDDTKTVVVTAPPPVAVTPPPAPVPVAVEPPPVVPDDKPTPTKVEPDRTPPKPAAPSTGKLILSATEPGLTFFVDNKEVGKGSASVEVKSGSHKVKVVDRAKGINLQRTLKVKGGDEKYFEFEIGKGNLNLECPPGADVFVNGKKVGTTPIGPVSLFTGTHAITVKKGGAEYKKSVTMRAGDEYSMWVEFHTTAQ